MELPDTRHLYGYVLADPWIHASMITVIKSAKQLLQLYLMRTIGFSRLLRSGGIFGGEKILLSYLFSLAEVINPCTFKTILRKEIQIFTYG
jgi:hypothetical protein